VERVRREVEGNGFSGVKGHTETALFHAGCLGGRARVARREDGAWRCHGCHGTLAGEDADALLVDMALRGEA
jgi:hypothetical protein